MAHVLCIGSLHFDILCSPFTALPPPGGIQPLEAIDFAFSGNAVNVAAALRRLDMTAEVAGAVGDDMIGTLFLDALSQMGVGTARVQRYPGMGTGTSIVALASNGERSISYTNGSNLAFDLAAIPPEWLAEVRVIVMSSVLLLPQFTGAAIHDLFHAAHARGATTVLNTCWDTQKLGLGYLSAALPETDYFILSYDEGRQLTGHTLLEDIVAELQTVARGAIILTLGAEGCYLCIDQQRVQVPAVPVRAVDSTGAGDTFVAGFVAGLLQGRSPLQCEHLANHVASYAVTGPGAYTRIPPLSVIEAHAFASFSESTRHIYKEIGQL